MKITLQLSLCVTMIFTLLIITKIKSQASTAEVVAGIKQFQIYINNKLPQTHLVTPLIINGVYGESTKIAAVKLLQYMLNNNYSAGLDIDGHFGPESQVAFNEYRGTIERYQKNDDYVYILQGLLYCNDYDPKGFDGSYGSGGGTGCLNAVNQYKSDYFISEYPDTTVGAVGVETMASLCWKPYRLEELPDGIYYIQNYFTQYYMDVENSGEVNYTNVNQTRVKDLYNNPFSRPLYHYTISLKFTSFKNMHN